MNKARTCRNNIQTRCQKGHSTSIWSNTKYVVVRPPRTCTVLPSLRSYNLLLHVALLPLPLLPLFFPLGLLLITSCVQKRMHVKLSACHRNCRNDTVGHFRQDRGLYTLEISTRRGRRRKVSIFNFLHLQWQTSGGPGPLSERERGMRQFSVFTCTRSESPWYVRMDHSMDRSEPLVFFSG